jgi:hypothetical protein
VYLIVIGSSSSFPSLLPHSMPLGLPSSAVILSFLAYSAKNVRATSILHPRATATAAPHSKHDTAFIVEGPFFRSRPSTIEHPLIRVLRLACLIPVLVIISGILAGEFYR